MVSSLLQELKLTKTQQEKQRRLKLDLVAELLKGDGSSLETSEVKGLLAARPRLVSRTCCLLWLSRRRSSSCCLPSHEATFERLKTKLSVRSDNIYLMPVTGFSR